MSAVDTVEETPKPDSKPVRKTAAFPIRVVEFLSSVKFGVVLLCILVFLSMVGMIIIQQNVSGFDAYYAGLTPAEKAVFGGLGLFDIYYSVYFNAILLVLSLNLVLASIDRFPSAWSYISKPKLNATEPWLRAKRDVAEVLVKEDSDESVVERIKAAMKRRGLSATVTERDGRTFVFGESGKYNRIGAYIVHVCLLTLFLGHFVAFQTGFDADVGFQPGQTTNEIELIEFALDKQNRFAVALPFTITCIDIQQKLIDPGGSIETFNTLDWRTRIEIDDPDFGKTVADVSLNNPFTYRGYRFFQAQTIPVGNARMINLELVPESGGTPIKVEIMRNGETVLKDGTKIKYTEFLPDFTFNDQGQPDTKSGDYNNPTAVLSVTKPGADPERVFAFGGNVADDLPVGAPKAGYKWRLKSFEKSPRAHILSIKYDPFNGAFIAWYFGGIGLIGALSFVFFYSHRRIWAMVEKSDGGYDVLLSGEANRNQSGFEDRFKKLAHELDDDKDSEREG